MFNGITINNNRFSVDAIKNLSKDSVKINWLGRRIIVQDESGKKQKLQYNDILSGVLGSETLEQISSEDKKELLTKLKDLHHIDHEDEDQQKLIHKLDKLLTNLERNGSAFEDISTEPNAEDSSLTTNTNSSDFLRAFSLSDEDITELPSLPQNIQILDLSGCKNLQTLPNPLPSSLKTIILKDTKITELPTLPNGLEVLDLTNCRLTRLPNVLPSNLKTMILDKTKIAELPPLPNSLEVMDLSSTNLKKLPDPLPSNLKTMILKDTRIAELPPLPDSLEVLDLSGCLSIIKLPDPLPSNLKTMILKDTKIAELPPLPDGIEILDLTNCKNLTSVPDILPSSLKTMILKNLNIAELPPLPDGIEILDLTNCKNLTSVPEKLPLNLKTLNLSSTGISKLPVHLPDSLEFLGLSRCNDLNSLPDRLPSSLKTLDLTRTSITSLPVHLPVGLESLILAHCGNLASLPNTLPASLKTLILQRLEITKLPNLPDNLEVLEIWDCGNLPSLPNTLPASLKTMILQRLVITELPSQWPSSLEQLNLNNCRSLTKEVRTASLSALLDTNFDQGLKLYKSFGVEPETLIRLFAEKMKGEPLDPNQDITETFTSLMSEKLADPDTPPDMITRLAKLVMVHQVSLRLHDEHPLIQQCIEVASMEAAPEKKNPFQLYKKLTEMSNEPSDFKTPVIKIGAEKFAINLQELKQMAQGSEVQRSDLPKGVTREAFDKFFNGLKTKIESNQEASTKALESLGTNWSAIEVPILDDPNRLLIGLLDLTEGPVPEVEAKWKAVLNNIFQKSTNERPGEFFTEQEEVFIMTMMGIQNCSGGKTAGIALSYDALDPKYRYQVSLTTGVNLDENAEKKVQALALVKTFIAENPNLTAEALAQFVNANMENQVLVTPFLEGDAEYWDDMAINISEIGAKALIDLAQKDAAKPIIFDIIQRVIANQFSGTNKLMQELTGEDNVNQGAHQGIYLKNLIGPFVGASHKVVFDKYTSVLYDQLIEKNREEVLEVFFKHVSPKTFAEAVMQMANANEENKNLLKPLLNEASWGKDGKLTQAGALELLTQVGLVLQTHSS